MGIPAIMVSSVTYALRGQKILRSFGIKSEIERTARRANEKSCSYSIIVNQDKTDEAEKILIKHGIKVIGRTERLGEK